MKSKAKPNSFPPRSYFAMTGMTLIQIMMLLLVLGIVGYFIVDVIIDKRCAEQPQRPMCIERKAEG